MTQEDKQLLLKDLCARLPYGLKVKCEKYSFPVTILYGGNIDEVKFKETGGIENICTIKLYLFPLSSMTEEMLEELNTYGFFKYRDTIANVSHLENNGEISKEIYTYIDIESISVLIEFFHSHHIDYRGFIEKGLAIDATGLNIY